MPTRGILSCSVKTRSEIVVPIFVNGTVVGEVDVDSRVPAAFTDADRVFLEEVARITGEYIENRRRSVLRPANQDWLSVRLPSR